MAEPSPLPNVNKAFKKAHNATISPPVVHPIVTKKQIQDLESLRKKPKPELNLNPPNMKRVPVVNGKREKDIARMKERLQQAKDRTRNDFGRSL